MKKIIIYSFLLTVINLQAQEKSQIDSIQYIGINNDSLEFVVHSTINGGFGLLLDEDGNYYHIEIVEYIEIEEENSIKANILYSQGLPASCYCPLETTIKIKKDIYFEAVVEVMLRQMVGGSHINPEFGEYKSVDVKTLNLLTLNINNQIVNGKKSIYPNPVKDVLYVNFEEYKNSSFEIYDIQGILQFSTIITSENAINVSFLISGMYLIFKDKKFIGHIIKN